MIVVLSGMGRDGCDPERGGGQDSARGACC